MVDLLGAVWCLLKLRECLVVVNMDDVDVFMLTSVKLLSGSLSHENPGNQFGHAAPIFTIILLAITAVLQIICLNRGLKVYDSTLVVPVFYGVYTATGWLDSLIFNDEVGAYQSWTLFLIFVSILVLISGVVLLTHKKPEPITGKIKSTALPRRRRKGRKGKSMIGQNGSTGHVEEGEDDEENGHPDAENEVLWAVGDASDEGDDDDDDDEDEDVDHHQHPLHKTLPTGRIEGTGSTATVSPRGARTAVNEQTGLVGTEANDEILGNSLGRLGSKSDDRRGRRSMDPFRDEEQELDDFSSVGLQSGRTQR